MDDKKEKLRVIVFAIVGVGVSILSFIAYYSLHHWIATSLICTVDVAYAYFNAVQFFDAKDWRSARKILIPLMMIVYWVVIFALLCLVTGSFSTQYFLYPMFLMPAFVLEIFLFALFGMGI